MNTLARVGFTAPGAGAADTKAFSDARLDEWWNGRAGETIAAPRDLRKLFRSPSKRESLQERQTYLANHRKLV